MDKTELPKCDPSVWDCTNCARHTQTELRKYDEKIRSHYLRTNTLLHAITEVIQLELSGLGPPQYINAMYKIRQLIGEYQHETN